MKTKLIAALLVAFSVSAAAPAFASGYGPAPFYRPAAGAPVSQRGPSVQTLAAERDDVTGSQEAYGGVVAGLSQAGSHAVVTSRDNLFARH
jgi:shikimate kinase